MTGPPSTRYAREPSYAGCSSDASPNMVLNRGRSGSKSLANMMPPEYCHSCKGDGVCADTTCDRPPHRSSARKYSGRERTLRGISKTPMIDDIQSWPYGAFSAVLRWLVSRQLTFDD